MCFSEILLLLAAAVVLKDKQEAILLEAAGLFCGSLSAHAGVGFPGTVVTHLQGIK